MAVAIMAKILVQYMFDCVFFFLRTFIASNFRLTGLKFTLSQASQNLICGCFNLHLLFERVAHATALIVIISINRFADYIHDKVCRMKIVICEVYLLADITQLSPPIAHRHTVHTLHY